MLAVTVIQIQNAPLIYVYLMFASLLVEGYQILQKHALALQMDNANLIHVLPMFVFLLVILWAAIVN